MDDLSNTHIKAAGKRLIDRESKEVPYVSGHRSGNEATPKESK